MKEFEHIIGLMHGNGPGSASLEQHVSAMRMDANFGGTFNRLVFTMCDAMKLTR